MTSNPNMLLKLWQNGRSMLLVSVILTWCFSAFGQAQTMLNPTAPPVKTLQVAGIKFMIEKGQLLARATTKQGRNWQFGKDIQTIAIARDQVFALSAQGKLTALVVIDGQQKWSVFTGLQVPPTTEMKLIVLDKTIIASALHPVGNIQDGRLPTLAAFDTNKGTKLWGYSTKGACQSNGTAVVYSGKVVWSFFCSFAFSYTVLRTFDIRSGELLWERQASKPSNNSTEYGYADKGLIYVVNSMPTDLQWDVYKVNILTGKYTTRTISIPLNYRPSCGMIEQTWDRRFEGKNILFIAEDMCGHFIHRFSLW